MAASSAAAEATMTESPTAVTWSPETLGSAPRGQLAAAFLALALALAVALAAAGGREGEHGGAGHHDGGGAGRPGSLPGTDQDQRIVPAVPGGPQAVPRD